tara:strand:- start:2267 stop:3316 length:1050 start_codon:yes stop_codon:yes gene_type:complete
MAQPTDLTGMLTEGLFQPTQKAVPSSYRESILGAAQSAGTGLRRGVGALTGADTMTAAEALQQQLRGLNAENVDDQKKIVSLVAQVDPARALAVQTQFNKTNRERAASQSSLARQQTQDAITQRRLDLEQQRVDVERERLKRGKDLTNQDRAVILDAQQAAEASETNVYTMTRLAKQYEADPPSAGFRGTVVEAWNDTLGTQDEQSRMKTEFQNIVNTGIINSLPPGVASDKDIEMARSGFMNKNWNSDQIAQYLRGMAKLSAFNTERDNLKAKWVSENRGDISGFNEAWRELRMSEGYKEAVAAKYDLPAYRLPPPVAQFNPDDEPTAVVEPSVADRVVANRTFGGAL